MNILVLIILAWKQSGLVSMMGRLSNFCPFQSYFMVFFTQFNYFLNRFQLHTFIIYQWIILEKGQKLDDRPIAETSPQATNCFKLRLIFVEACRTSTLSKTRHYFFTKIYLKHIQIIDNYPIKYGMTSNCCHCCYMAHILTNNLSIISTLLILIDRGKTVIKSLGEKGEGG